MKTAFPKKSGFTLTEIMITMAVLSMLMAAVMSFFIQSLRSMHATEQRMNLAAQIKKFSSELIVHASRSNQFLLFKTANAADFSPGSVDLALDTYSARQIMLPVEGDVPLLPGGDFAAFIYFEFPKPVAQPYHRIQKIVGFYLESGAADRIGAVKKVVMDFTGAEIALTNAAGNANVESIENILTTNWNKPATKFSTYFPLVRGVAVPQVVDGVVADPATVTPRLFFMTDVRNVIINGQIYSANKNRNTKDWRTYTNAFCFNITPRT